MAASEQLALRACGGENLALLPLPLDPAKLYQELARQLRRESSSRQLRIRVDLPVQIKVRDETYQTVASLLSERSLRFQLPLELARGEQLEVQIQLGNRQYSLNGEVSYVLLGKELGWGEERIDIGAIFRPLAASTREYIRNWIIGCYLQRLQQAEAELLTEGFGQLQLTTVSSAMLS